MYSVLIADDEESIREGMRYLIDWPSTGFRICGTARNGVEALEAVAKSCPDLILLDIRMPGLNGIECLKKLRANPDWDTEVIILSGFDEFSYAQEAISGRVIRYLLKPIDGDELIMALKDAAALINGKQRKKSMDLTDKTSCRFVRLVCDSAMPEAKPVEWIGPDFPYNIVSLASDETRFECAITIQNMVDITRFAAAAQKYAADKNNGAWSIAVLIGPRVLAANIAASREGAAVCANHHFYSPNPPFVIYDNIRDDFKNSLFDKSAVDFYSAALRSGNTEDSERACLEFISFLRENRFTLEIVQIYLSVLFLDAVDLIVKLDGDYAGVVARFGYIKEYLGGMTIESLRLFLLEFNRYTLELARTLRRNHSLGLAGQVLVYVQSHYAQELSLQHIAERFSLNPSYLGQLFKKATGWNFNNYLHYLRIKAAKDLLLSGDGRIYEIAQQVGYADPNYFAVKFQEMENITPTQFRKKHQKEQIG